MNTKWHEEGNEPDYRFSLANERTFLAWMRTALALLAGALIMRQVTGHAHPGLGNLALSGVLVLLAAILSVAGFWQWRANQIAMRHSRPLPRSLLMHSMSAAVLALSVGACVLVFG